MVVMVVQLLTILKPTNYNTLRAKTINKMCMCAYIYDTQKCVCIYTFNHKEYTHTVEYYSAKKTELNKAICTNKNGPRDYHTRNYQ